MLIKRTWEPLAFDKKYPWAKDVLRGWQGGPFVVNLPNGVSIHCSTRAEYVRMLVKLKRMERKLLTRKG